MMEVNSLTTSKSKHFTKDNISRTYNFPQGRVTDHRIGYTVYNLSDVISGELFSFTEKLRIAENAEKMKVGDGG